MLSCKEFVKQSYKVLDKETKLTFMQRMNFGMHQFLCIHCRRFFNQYRLLDDSCKHFPKAQTPQQHISTVMAEFRRIN